MLAERNSWLLHSGERIYIPIARNTATGQRICTMQAIATFWRIPKYCNLYGSWWRQTQVSRVRYAKETGKPYLGNNRQANVEQNLALCIPS